MQFEYTITKFDAENKIVTVVYEDGHWADILLANPLPENIEQLEKLIRMYTPPAEVIEARQAPSADLTYIDQYVNIPRTTDRMSMPIQMAEVRSILPQPQTNGVTEA
jgi:hypothetical protein